MMTLIHQHPYTSGMVAMWLFSTIVATMPSPKSNSGILYEWMFGILHAVGAGLPRLIATLAPNSPMSKVMGVPQPTQFSAAADAVQDEAGQAAAHAQAAQDAAATVKAIAKDGKP